jgi:hypothetical protein
VSSREREWRVPRADVATYRPKADGSVRALDVGKGSSQRRARGITPVPLAQTRAVSRGTRPIARLPRRPGGSASPHVPRCSRRRPARAGGGPRAQRPAAVATFGPVPVVRQWRRKDAGRRPLELPDPVVLILMAGLPPLRARWHQPELRTLTTSRPRPEPQRSRAPGSDRLSPDGSSNEPHLGWLRELERDVPLRCRDAGKIGDAQWATLTKWHLAPAVRECHAQFCRRQLPTGAWLPNLLRAVAWMDTV